MTYAPDVVGWLMLFGYLVGSIPFGVLIGKARGVDPRSVGSGNTGATNVWRALGPKAGILVLFLDAMKGCIPVLIARFVPSHGPNAMAVAWASIAVVLTGLAAMVGHNWPVFLKFKGGKGVATGLGVLWALDWRVGLAVLVVFVLVLAVTRYVSVASTVTTVLTPMWFAIFEHGQPRARANIIFAIAGALFIVYKHRANYGRLLAGTESRVGARPADAG